MKQTWNLETFFPGGSHSAELRRFLEEIQEGYAKITTLPLREALLLSQDLQRDLAEASAFIHCLGAQDTKDAKAKELQAKISALSAEGKKVKIALDEKLKELKGLDELKLDDIRFVLEERRGLAKKRLPAEKEALIEDLAIDGYHGWSRFHDTLVDSLSFPVGGKKLSQGQLDNCFSKGDRGVRREAFASYLSVYRESENHFGAVLNHIGGFRLKVYGARGWKSVLDEPCDYNRIERKTLETMWKVVAENRHRFVDFLKLKAKLLGVEKLAWYDLEAPIGEEKSDIPYDEGAGFILKHFHAVSPKLAAFSKRALDGAWVEVEDRVGKQPGGFCASLPRSKQSRVFMTYSNTISNLETLAHELGHAFHADCCFSLPYFNQNYAMNVAETASTMAEMIVADAAYKTAKTKEERLSLLNNKLTRTIAYLMNIHARFIFEKNFYEEREKGFLLPDRLSELMVAAQKEAYAGSLAEYNPLFWASKLHFFFTGVAFYNFPYTFGYLFSLGIYRELMKDKATFEEKYIALLCDTAVMSTEELAKKHLGVDLSKPAFWQGAIDSAAEDVEEFKILVSEK